MRALLVLAPALLLCACGHPSAPEEPVGQAHHPHQVTAASDGGAGEVVEPVLTDGGVAVVPAPIEPRPARVRILVRTTPPKARVSWGRTPLGKTPLTIDRPRDSGPLDLVVRSDGYFPVHTRAYTLKNDVIYLKMTKLADRMTIYGARKELPPAGTADGGVAPPAPPPSAPGGPPPGAPTMPLTPPG
jgi:hypothetical protein